MSIPLAKALYVSRLQGAATKEPIRMVLEGNLWVTPGECFSSPMVLNFCLSWRDLV